MRRSLLAKLLLAAVLFDSSPEANAQITGALHAGASCAGTEVSFAWTFVEHHETPTQHPEWVGYDVLRRSLGDCGAFVRVNAEPFPRVFGATHAHAYVEVPPLPGVTYQYRVILIDSERNEISLGSDCDCGASEGWAGCPDGPLTVGTLEDLGWALLVTPCPESCYGGFYFEGPLVEELRPYAGSESVFRFFGEEYCGTVEGCGMDVTSYELSACGPVQAASTTWGRLKALHR